MPNVQQAKLPIEPAFTTLFKLFTDTTSFCVPNYQRMYAWKCVPEISSFWDDVHYCTEQRSQNQRPYLHFFGQMISCYKGHTTTNLEQLDIIDGQQRITTLSLLCVAVAKRLKEIIDDATAKKSIRDMAKSLYSNIINRVIFHTAFATTTIRLKLQRSDENFYQLLVTANINNAADSTDPKTASQKNLKKALYYLIDKLSALGFDNKGFVSFTGKLIEALSEDCMVILLRVEKKIGLQHIFTTVNDRGLSLTTGELLKAKSMEVLDGYDAIQNEAEDIWNTILGDDSQKTERYLEYYYASMMGHYNEKSKLYDKYLNDIFPVCKKRKIIQAEADSFLELLKQLKSSIEILAKLDKGEWPYPITDASPCLWKRNRLKILTAEIKCKSVVAIFLSSFIHLSEAEFAKIVALAELNFFNTVLINSPSRYSKYTEVVYKEAKAIRDSAARYSSGTLKQAFFDFRRNERYDSEFITKLKGTQYKKEASNTTTRYFLYMMELFYNAFDNANYTAPDDAFSMDFGALSTEHIYSQSLQPLNQIPALEVAKNNIGNLCPIGKKKNSRWGDKPFSVKKTKYAEAGYRITRYLSTLADWNKAEHDKLEAKYVAIAQKLFIDNLGI